MRPSSDHRINYLFFTIPRKLRTFSYKIAFIFWANQLLQRDLKFSSDKHKFEIVHDQILYRISTTEFPSRPLGIRFAVKCVTHKPFITQQSVQAIKWNEIFDGYVCYSTLFGEVIWFFIEMMARNNKANDRFWLKRLKNVTVIFIKCRWLIVQIRGSNLFLVFTTLH